MNKYLEQYNRVKRWYGRFRSINSGKNHDMPSDYYQDEVYTFFVNCYHLKDWIKNDATCGISNSEVESFVSGSKFLKICGDICNGFKHLLITSPRIDRNTKVGKRHFSLILGGENSPVFSGKYEIEANGKIYDSFDIATKCMNEWTKFLKQKSLI